MLRLLAIGAAAGVFSALFGVGGGIIIVPLLVYVVGLAPRAATGTSLAALAFTAAAGAALQQRLPVRTLSYLFAALLVAIAIRMLLQ